MKSIAIIGTGIAGMSAAARLHPHFKITLYERNAYIGGHTNTVVSTGPGPDVPIDTGFMVYNEATYPRLTRLFADLKVETMPTEMSFGVYHPEEDYFWSSRFPEGLFARKRNLISPRFWTMFRDIFHFRRHALNLLENPSLQQATLAEFVLQCGLSDAFVRAYLVPMASSIWSTPPDDMLGFPAITLIHFMRNHRLLNVHQQHPWRTVVGGSRSYREKLIASFRDRIHTSRAATRVELSEQGAFVTDIDDHREQYDGVLIATHADEALDLIAQPTSAQSAILGAFKYSANDVCLHCDEGVMPPRRTAWVSWNHRADRIEDGTLQASTHYWMNKLQQLPTTTNWFVSVNPPPGLIDSHKICWNTTYHHPNFDLCSIQAQSRLPELNSHDRIWFAGSYFRYGFHEDALMAGQDAAESIYHRYYHDAAVVSL